MRYITLFLCFVLTASFYTATAASVTNLTVPSIVKEEKPKPVKKEPTVFERRMKRDAQDVYKKLFLALENNGYYVVFETDMGKNLSRFAQRWGDDHNKNKLESIQSLVFCNGWYANQVSNYDPKMLALCPMHITVTHKKGITSILYVRPSQVAKDSPAKKIANELEQDVVRIIGSIR